MGDWGDRYGEVGEFTSNGGDVGLFTPAPEGMCSRSLELGDCKVETHVTIPKAPLVPV